MIPDILWGEIVAMFGNEERARLFLEQKRPELEGKRPIDCIERGDTAAVENLLFAIRELLP